MFAIEVTAEMNFGMPKLFSSYSEWYGNHYESLKCFYTLNDPSSHFTGVDVEASLTGTFSLQGELEHANGTIIELPKTNLAVVNVGCGSLNPITVNRTSELEPLVFHSRDGSANVVLANYSKIVSDCSYCNLKYEIKVSNPSLSIETTQELQIQFDTATMSGGVFATSSER